MTEPKFKVGDVVQHKASGEKGVVTNVGKSCPKHKAPFECAQAKYNKMEVDCILEFNGFYSIVDSFGAEHKTVREIEIERVER